MHLSFESLAISRALDLQTSLMDIHHDTSLRSILEDDSISSYHICSCSSKGPWLWLVAKPFICSFCITHFTLTLALCFHLGLIQPSTFNLLMCECGHGLDTSSTHLIRYLFGNERIAMHDTIQNVIYVFTWENEHVVW